MLLSSCADVLHCFHSYIVLKNFLVLGQKIILADKLSHSGINCFYQIIWGKENAVAYIENNPDYRLELEHTIREKIFPGQVLRTKEGEVVTEQQIRDYEMKMRSLGVGTGFSSPEQKESETPAAPTVAVESEKEEAKTSKTSSKTASLAKAAASDKPVPEELF